MSMPDYPKILETPNHFWIDSVDLPYVVSGKGPTKIKHLGNDLVLVTKTFVAREYKYSPNEGFYEFAKPNLLDKQSKN